MSIEYVPMLSKSDLYPPTTPPRKPVTFPPNFKIHPFKYKKDQMKPRSLWHRDRHYDRFINGQAGDPEFTDYEYYPLVSSYGIDCHGNECPDEIGPMKNITYKIIPSHQTTGSITYTPTQLSYAPLIILAVLIIIVLSLSK